MRGLARRGDLPGRDLQCREQRGRAMPAIVMRPTRRPPGAASATSARSDPAPESATSHHSTARSPFPTARGKAEANTSAIQRPLQQQLCIQRLTVIERTPTPSRILWACGLHGVIPRSWAGQISKALDRLIRRWLNTDMRIGEVWAFRDHPKTVGEPVYRVEVVRLGGPRQQGDAHIRFLDGEEAGLQEWVSRTQLVVPWEEASKFARDDENWQTIIEQSPETRGKVEFDAARLVIEVAQLKRLIKLRQGGICEITDPEKIAKILGLAPDTLLHEPLSFVDRLGNLITPWSATLLLIQGVARQFSDEIFQATQRRHEALKDRYDRSWQCNDNDLVRGPSYPTGPRMVRRGGERATRRATGVACGGRAVGHPSGTGHCRTSPP